MRSYFNHSTNLSDSLPFVSQSILPYPIFSSTPITISDLVQQLNLQTYSLPVHATYQEVSNFFRLHPDALGVLILEECQGTANPIPVGLVSRQQWLHWRSHRPHWRAALNQRLTEQSDWWQQATDYVLIDHQLPLPAVINRLLQRPAAAASEPVRSPFPPEPVCATLISSLLPTLGSISLNRLPWRNLRSKPYGDSNS
ncbi:MAG: hypothetical protein HC881_10675 [Leptolyngbyaceae cyanobacterium SL_7_1]|nr:hypothetical protein [Leptolyngbyaceae cyanobacterium SL_7_1]